MWSYLKGFVSPRFSIDSTSASALRIGYVLYMLFFYGFQDFTFLADIPDFFYFPTWLQVIAWASGFPSLYMLLTIQSLSFLALLSLLVGYRTFWASWTFGLSQIVLHGFLYSMGKINHNFLLHFMPICMAYANWGNAFSVDHRQQRKTHFNASAAISVLAAALAFSFFTAGWSKLSSGWLAWDSQPLLSLLERRWNMALFNKTLLLVFAELGEWFTVVLEFAFLLLFPKPKLFAWTTLAAMLFHTVVAFTLNISFFALPIVYLAFLIRLPHAPRPFFLKEQQLLKILTVFALVMAIIYLPYLWATGKAIAEQGMLHQLFNTLMPNQLSSATLMLLLTLCMIIYTWRKGIRNT